MSRMVSGELPEAVRERLMFTEEGELTFTGKRLPSNKLFLL